jgi:hypothetical protein
MSRGSQVIPVRIPGDELEMVDSTISRINRRRREEPMTRSSFIRSALAEKLSHLERSKRKKTPQLTHEDLTVKT